MPKSIFVYTDPTIETSALGDTPYGLYDSDATFVSESVNVCKFVAKKMGHPVMQIEMPSSSIYACFEEAISEYSTQINNYNIKNWMWDQYGEKNKISGSLGTGVSNVKHPKMGISVALSEQYGTAAGVGGSVEMKSGSITLEASKQTYDLQSVWADVSESGKRIEVQNVFNYGEAAISRFYDPFAGSFDQRQLLDNFGLGNVAPAISFILKPISYDLARANMIETSDKIRRSAHSFNIVDNKVKIFPRPTSNDSGQKVWFQYYVRDDKNSTSRDFSSGSVSDPSNAPYKFITYSSINAPGRQWIRRYTLALSKELLGIIRSKYSAVPIPDGEMTLDGEALKSEAIAEKNQLNEELREFLESISLTEKSKAEAEQADAVQQVLSKAPLPIFIG